MRSAKSPSILFLGSISLGGLLATSVAVADTMSGQASPELTLDRVLVSASRTESSKKDVARPISVIEKQELELSQPQSVAEAIKNEPNISISGGPRAGNQGVNIRGLQGNKVLQVVDGVRQSFQSGHRPTYFLDPELLKSVEVVKGPASSLWGSGAIGGVVAQNTIMPTDLIASSQEVGGFVKTSLNANNDQQTYLAALAARAGAVDVLLNPYFRESNDLEQGNGENLDNSGKRDHGLLGKAQWQVDDDQAFTLTYRQSEESGGIPSNASTPLSSSVFLIDRDTETRNVALEYALDTDSDWVDAQLSLFTDHVEMNEARVSDGRGDATELDAFGLAINNRSATELVTLTYGVDAYINEFEASRSGTNRPVPPDSELSVWGAYVNARFGIVSDLDAELGARYDKFETEAKNLGVKSNDSDVSPSLALIWQASSVLEVTLRHDRAFRAPSSEELYTTGTHFCMGPGLCNTFVSNPDLKPEKAANTELMMRGQLAPNSRGGQLAFEGSIFENNVDDFIEQRVEGMSFFPVMSAGTTTWRNVDKATIKGFELATTYLQDSFALKVSYGQTEGKDDATGADLEQIPAAKFVVDASQRLFGQSVIAGVRVTSAKTQNQVNDGEVYDGYTLTDLYASWSPAELEGLRFDLTVNNVTDRYYRQAWQQLYEPGRELIVATKYSF